MRGDKAFIDSNILLYLYSDSEADKKAICVDALGKYRWISSTQAINEFCNVFLRKWKRNSDEAQIAIREIRGVCKIFLLDFPTIVYAVELYSKYGFSYYDCLMLSSAIRNRCKYILTEDMQDGQIVDGLEIVNIFERGRL
ncbi:MAG: PIN domain-containing protein [Clostridiales bacterium]|jgi:predicted nucleic acid-binding protein|nr:PIN domain-containing protein [Clostridiales bacterium]